MIDDRSVQRALAAAGAYPGPIDGAFGDASRKALPIALTKARIDWKGWTYPRCRIAYEQLMMRGAGIEVGDIDGRDGPQTRFALERWQDLNRDVVAPAPIVAHQPTIWPRQKDVQAFFGEPGTGLISLALPYPLRLAWDPATKVEKMQIHRAVADSAHRAFMAELDVFGHDQIVALGMDLFGGCYQPRNMRGGTSLSMHAWGIAIDRDPVRNPLRADHTKANFAKPAYAPMFKIWAAEGWISLGRERDFDWMHQQAARL